ncbi:MAG: T9SS C-terminal target domain-containing protein [Saprospirales bacterium]|nr:MAG: T9SS C-terminal target domain-containing protein [Saprospirales bacterium]
MKLHLHQLLLFGILLFSIFLLGNATFPPPANTGAPGEGLCSDCHGGNNPLGLDGDIVINGLPHNPMDGERYQLEVILRNPNGLASRGGFQMVVLDGQNNNFGQLENPSNNSRTRNFGGKQYFEHNPARNFPGGNEIVWTVDWIAPNNPSNREVNIYASGNIADGNGDSSNDFIVTTLFQANLELPSSTAEIRTQALSFFPNPTSEVLNVKGISNGSTYRYQIVDPMGRLVDKGELTGGSVNVKHLPVGTYFITIANEGEIHSGKFIKQ